MVRPAPRPRRPTSATSRRRSRSMAHENANGGQPRSTATSTPRGSAPSDTPPAASRWRRWRPPTPRSRRSSAWPGRRWGCPADAKHGPGSTVPHQPGLLMSGTADTVVPTAGMITAYGKMHAPKRLILIKGAGHLVFADICEIGLRPGRPSRHRQRAQGAHPGLAQAAGDRRLRCHPTCRRRKAGRSFARRPSPSCATSSASTRSAAGLSGLVGAYPNVVSADESKS